MSISERLMALALAVVTTLTIATLSMMVMVSYQLGQTIGRLDVLISHVTLK